MMYAVKMTHFNKWVATDCNGNPQLSKDKLDLDCLLNKQQMERAVQRVGGVQVVRFTQW